MSEQNKPEEQQASLFPDMENEWQREWHDMPEFNMQNKEPIKQLIISFANWEDYKKFAKLIDQPLTRKTQSVWYPPAKIETYMDKRYTVDMEIGDKFYFDSHGTTREAIFREDLGNGLISAVICNDNRFEGTHVTVKKSQIKCN